MTPGNEHAILSQPVEREGVDIEVWGWQRSQVRGQGHLLRGLLLDGWGIPKIEGCGDTGGRRGTPTGN